MKRMHVNLAVEDLEASVAFYSMLFGAAPSVRHVDYAKWLLDDPRVNFAIAARGRAPGLDHLGIQVESGEELAEVTGRLKAAGQFVLDQKDAACCYARSDKGWVHDPQGVVWETFHTKGAHTSYGEDTLIERVIPAAGSGKAPCCAPKVAATVGG
jgi:catechol 2,3-dioxygenase-like lactoylglutathione lyase family enzyme